MREPDYHNVILDTHPYQCFTDDDRKRDLHGQVQHALFERKKLLEDIEQATAVSGRRVVVRPAAAVTGRPQRAWHSTWPCGPTATPS